MIKMTEVFERIKGIILQVLPNNTVDAVTPDAHIINDLGADSLDVVEIIMECERRFSIGIPDADIENLATVKQLTCYITDRLKNNIPAFSNPKPETK